MSMRDAILNFHTQFEFEPKVEHGENLGEYSSYIVCGMGGSNLAGGLLEIVSPGTDIYSHRDYDLPAMSEKRLKESLVILSSYSGNTEETISAYWAAKKKGIPMAAVSAGWRILEFAKHDKFPHVEIPDTGIQPRMATGFNFLALLKIMRKENEFAEARALAAVLKPAEQEEAGKSLAERIRGKVPIIYASRKNRGLSYNWKIKFNETGKTPAFANVLPELNHNEMTGFDVVDSTRALSSAFHFIFLRDSADSEKIQKRMDVLGKLYRDRGLLVEEVVIEGDAPYLKIFSSLVLADWTALYTGESYGVETEQVPMVEEFKKAIS